MSRRTTALAAAGGLVVVAAIAAQVTAPTGALPVPEVVPVAATELICPDVQTTADGSMRSTVSAVTPSNLAVGTVGRARIGTLTKPASIATLDKGKRSVTKRATSNLGAVVGTAVGARAPGFAMDQLKTSSARASHGLSGVTCVEPNNDI